MMRRVIVAMLVVGAGAARAEAQSPGLRLTLDEAVTRAFEASHRLAEARARLEGAQATVQIRQSAARPIANATAGYTRTNHVDEFGVPAPGGGINIFYPDVPDNFITRIAAQWPIYTAGRTDALERAAASEASAAGAELDTARADLRFEVTRSYWAVATSREAVRVLEESVARAEAQVRDARQRLDVGLVPPSDVLTFEAQRASEELQLIEAINLLESSLVDLRRLIGADPNAAIEIADRLDTPRAGADLVPAEKAAAGAQADPEAARLVAEALEQRPELRALTFRIEGAQARQAAAATGRRPTVALGGGYDFNKPNPKIFPREDIWQRSWDVGLNMSWTVFDSGRTRAEVAEAAAAVRATEERQKDLDTVVSADVRQRLLDLRSSQAAVRAEDPEDLPRLDGERKVVHRDEVAEATRQSANVDGGHGLRDGRARAEAALRPAAR